MKISKPDPGIAVDCCVLLTAKGLKNESNVFTFLEYALEISGGTFSHLRDKKPVLKDINMRVKPGSLTALVGSVGCGKSSLLSALIGDLYKHSGTVTVKVRKTN